MKRRARLIKFRFKILSAIVLLACFFCIAISSVINPVTAKSPGWVVRSDEFAKQLTKALEAEECQKKTDLSDRLREIDQSFKLCRQETLQRAVQTLEQNLVQEKNSDLRLDLELLLNAGQQSLQSYALDEKYRLPYINLSKEILETLKSIVKESKSTASKQDAILAKLSQFAGLESNKIALAPSLERAMQSQLQKIEVALPSKERLEKDLKNSTAQVYEIQMFLEQQKISKAEVAFDQLKTQLFNYETFLRQEVLPKTEQNFRLPRELYNLQLEKHGVETPIETVMQQAHTAFTQIQQEMAAIAPQIAQRRKLKASNYREVIQSLKQERLSPKDTLRLYKDRAKVLEDIIQQQHLVTLPGRDLNIRLATEKEYGEFPIPRYIAASGTFILPVARNPKEASLYNDFTNPSMAWTLTVHEGRPGHDLQFATLRGQKLSQARTHFAANATSTEGWATYTEAMMQPYLPIEGKFMSLQFQLLRAARAFLEPELQLGKITPAEALKTLTQDVGFSKFFAEQEVKRYTATMQGQAPAYFYGAQQIWQLRSQFEKQLGKQFTLQKFHDFVLSQGFLTPTVLQKSFSTQIQ
jgi:uncharacterized protein (DUF885 family)